MLDFSEKTILISGASGGLGIFFADYYLKNGVKNLALQYNSNPAPLRQLAEKHNIDFDRHCFKADLSNESDVNRLGREVRTTFGTVYAVINLIGLSINAVSWKTSLENFRKIIDANLTSVFLCSKEFIPGMRDKKEGRLIYFSSVTSFIGMPGASAYCAAKSGIIGFARTVALELSNKNITANVIAPGYFNFGMIHQVPEQVLEDIRKRIPVGRLGSGEELVALIDYLLSESGKYMTGQVMHLNGGLY